MQNLSSLVHTRGSQDHNIQISIRSVCVCVCVCVCFLSEFPFSVLISLEICSQYTLLVLITHLDQGTLDKVSFLDQSEACHEPGLRKEKTRKASVLSRWYFNSSPRCLQRGPLPQQRWSQGVFVWENGPEQKEPGSQHSVHSAKRGVCAPLHQSQVPIGVCPLTNDCVLPLKGRQSYGFLSHRSLCLSSEGKYAMLIMKACCSGVFQEHVIKTESCILANMCITHLHNKIPSNVFHTVLYVERYNTVSQMHGFLTSSPACILL